MTRAISHPEFLTFAHTLPPCTQIGTPASGLRPDQPTAVSSHMPFAMSHITISAVSNKCPTFPTLVTCLLMGLLLHTSLSHPYSTCSPCSRQSPTDVNAFTVLFTFFTQSSHSVLSQILSPSRASLCTNLSLFFPYVCTSENSSLLHCLSSLSQLWQPSSSLSDACCCVHHPSHHVSSILRVLLHLSPSLH